MGNGPQARFARVNQTILLFAAYASPVLAVAQIISYARLRYANSLLEHPDPHLGRKFALHALLNACAMMFLSGVSLLASEAGIRWAEAAEAADVAAAAAAAAKPLLTTEFRAFAALAASGAMHGIVLVAVLAFFTNDRRVPTVRRAMYGLRFFFSMIVLLIANTYSLILVSDTGPVPLARLAPALPLSLIWGFSAVLHGVLLLRAKPGEPVKEHDPPPV
jgi:hypothetical protein